MPSGLAQHLHELCMCRGTQFLSG